MPTIKIKKQAAAKIRQGRRLLLEKDLLSVPPNDGNVVEVLSPDGQWVAQALIARQNKGLGWIYADQRVPLDEAYFLYLIEQAISKRQTFFADPLTTAFRLYNGEGDGLGGFSVDYYDQYLLIQWYSSPLYAYREWICQALLQCLPDTKGIVGKNRFKDRGPLPISEVLRGNIPENIRILENGVTYRVQLNEGWMTGLFLDQREVRAWVSRESAGLSILNTFSYAGAFSLAAAMGGAKETVSVDLAKRSLALTAAQFAANQLPMTAHTVYVMDTFRYLAWAQKKGLKFDLIILDPPSFARNKKTSFKATRDYRQLVEAAAPLLKHKGRLLASTNASNYPKRQFKRDLMEGLSVGNETTTLCQEFGLPADFPIPPHSVESDYLKVFIYAKD